VQIKREVLEIAARNDSRCNSLAAYVFVRYLQNMTVDELLDFGTAAGVVKTHHALKYAKLLLEYNGTSAVESALVYEFPELKGADVCYFADLFELMEKTIYE
jgi:hypothetical protein